MAPHPQRLTVTRRAWPLARPLMTADGIETTVDVVVAEIADGEGRGRGEGVPLRRYGESIDSVVAAVDAMKGAVFSGLNRDTRCRRVRRATLSTAHSGTSMRSVLIAVSRSWPGSARCRR